MTVTPAMSFFWQLLAVLIAGIVHRSSCGTMDFVHSWKHVDFNFPSAEVRAEMIDTGKFIPANVIPIDIDVWEGPSGQKMFVTTPRLRPGVPAVLSTVAPDGKLSPYPSWADQTEGDCNITSVYRVDIDHCGRLWVADSGRINDFLPNATTICPPKILVYDLYNDKPAQAPYEFPPGLITELTDLATVAVDARGAKCEDTHVYITDVDGYKLLVYNPKERTSWQVNDRFFHPDPNHAYFHINGVGFELLDVVIGLALGPLNERGDRWLYFHSLASVRESWVPTSVIQNSTLFTDGDGSPLSFQVSRHPRNSVSGAETMSPSGVLFFGLINLNSIACWNSRLPYTQDNIVTIAKNNTSLQFVSGLKYRNGKIWSLTNRLQNFIVGKVPADELNYFISTGNIDVLTRGTKCQPSPMH